MASISKLSVFIYRDQFASKAVLVMGKQTQAFQHRRKKIKGVRKQWRVNGVPLPCPFGVASSHGPGGAAARSHKICTNTKD